MLYLTTKDKFETYTTPHALRSDRAPNGGLFLPFRMPSYCTAELAALEDRSFSQCVADILNTFFSCSLSGWDIEFSAGRYPVKLYDMRHRIWVGELWHNQDGVYTRLEKTLSEKICDVDKIPSWAKIAIRIAVLFGLYGEMLRGNVVKTEQTFDVTLPTGDFSACMAVWYARRMGLPVKNIICGCNENSAVWDLLHIGELRSDVPVVATSTPEADFGIPEELERLIHAALGVEEALCYCEICSNGGIYTPYPGMLDTLRNGLFGAVVSGTRLNAAIPSVYNTCGYIMGPYTALAYSALQDYRAKTGESRVVLLLADKSPAADAKLVAAAMGVTEQTLKRLLGGT